MSEKKVYAMAPEGCDSWLTAGKVYAASEDHMGGFDFVSDSGVDNYSRWEQSSHLNNGNWTRLELTEEEAEAINNGSKVLVDASDADGEKWVVADPQGDDEVSEVSEMLEYIARHVTEWPKGATSVRVDDDGEICFEGNGDESDFYPSPRFEGKWVAEGDFTAIGKFYSRDEWEQARSDLLLHIHPQSELDADQYTAGADTISGDGTGESLPEVEDGEVAHKMLQYNPEDVKFYDDECETPLTGHDTVNAPSHYTSGDIECIDAIRAQMTPEQFAGYLRGNLVKYVWRYEHKGGVESLRKAEWYLRRLIDVAE